MYDQPIGYPTPDMEEPSLDICDETTRSFFQEHHDSWTIEQFEALENYLHFKCRKLRAATEKECTIEDFEKAKSQDIDDDNEEGES